MPAAIGMRFVISIRTGGPSHPVAARNSRKRARRQVLALDPGTDDFVKPKGARPL